MSSEDLQSIVDSADKLHDVALNCPTGAQSVRPVSDGEPGVAAVNDLVKTDTWLNGQLFDHKCEIKAAEEECTPGDDVEKIQESILKLKQELLLETSKLSLKEMILRRLQLGNALSRNLFGDLHGRGDAQTEAANNESLESLVMTQCELVMEIMQNEKSMEKMKDTLKTVKDKNFELKVQNRELMSVLRQKRDMIEEKAAEFSKDEEGQSLKEKLESIVAKIVIVRHTLQGLILGSGINWAQDPKMEELLISLGEPLNI